jgi:hypothetical protein
MTAAAAAVAGIVVSNCAMLIVLRYAVQSTGTYDSTANRQSFKEHRLTICAHASTIPRNSGLLGLLTCTLPVPSTNPKTVTARTPADAQR